MPDGLRVRARRTGRASCLSTCPSVVSGSAEDEICAVRCGTERTAGSPRSRSVSASSRLRSVFVRTSGARGSRASLPSEDATLNPQGNAVRNGITVPNTELTRIALTRIGPDLPNHATVRIPRIHASGGQARILFGAVAGIKGSKSKTRPAGVHELQAVTPSRPTRLLKQICRNCFHFQCRRSPHPAEKTWFFPGFGCGQPLSRLPEQSRIFNVEVL